MSIVAKTISTIVFVGALCFAISSAESELWLTVWSVLLLFLGIPFSLLVLRDMLIFVAPKWLGPSQMLLHLCAIFAARLGYVLGSMAISSEHEKADLHQLLVFILPLFVYSTPLIMIFHGLPISRIKEFYFKSSQGKK
jgi:hypothetical protein